MRTFKMTLAYDGSNYYGWQLQPRQTSVQEVLEAALERVLGAPIRVAGSSRTDSGVHALGQLVSFSVDTRISPEALARAVNHYLPEDVSVRGVEEAAPDFHAVRDAVRKRYRYILFDGRRRDVFRRRYCWNFWGRLDADAMHRSGQALVGTHDFRSFETHWPTRQSSVRTIFDVSVRRESEPFDAWTEPRKLATGPVEAGQGGGIEPAGASDYLHIEVEADGFLYNMVRTIVGTLLEVGRGTQTEHWPGEVLAAMDRRVAGRTAPAEGLFLLWIKTKDELGPSSESVADGPSSDESEPDEQADVS